MSAALELHSDWDTWGGLDGQVLACIETHTDDTWKAAHVTIWQI